ncbi:GntR family transcriptional regulator [Sinorhizobium sp. BG8]|uniref:GntR family transcriptional regulator n=1 Tax=Sinorhizobium sp. BG8 TaxID=2613773 RepID=UPI00193E42E3|nr:GntR family transcriptional regulator [Sinorhizobium sp. BG8]QRM57040.1 GntR family transcriptional regulator [Sinorhizobium sp. BG8]QRM57907.1 GntR family transcriptional regulator [Sinorhizobium sp. BG8]
MQVLISRRKAGGSRIRTYWLARLKAHSHFGARICLVQPLEEDDRHSESALYMHEAAKPAAEFTPSNCTALKKQSTGTNHMTTKTGQMPSFAGRRPILDNEFIYNELKQLLMIGEFLPGQKITLPMLADAFGTSQMPIREATNRLIAARAIEAPPRRSLCIPEATTERMDSLLPLRLLLEGEATRLAVIAKGAELAQELAAITEEMDSKVPSEDIKAYLRLNQKFHFHVYQTCGNPELVDMIELLWMRYGPMLNIVRSGVLSKSGHKRHLEIIKGFQDQDPEAAATAMRADIQDAAVPIREVIESKLREQETVAEGRKAVRAR